MNRLFEAFASTIIQNLYNANSEQMNALFRATAKHGFSFKGLADSKIITKTPREAFKYGGEEGDKYLKIWLYDETHIAFCTWANTMIDGQFKWNAKGKGSAKRDNNRIIGDKNWIKEYLKSNSTIDKLAKCYMIPFANLGQKAVKMVQTERELYFAEFDSLKKTLASGSDISKEIAKEFEKLKSQYKEAISTILAAFKDTNILEKDTNDGYEMPAITIKMADWIFGSSPFDPSVRIDYRFAFFLPTRQYRILDEDITFENVKNKKEALKHFDEDSIRKKAHTMMLKHIKEVVDKVLSTTGINDKIDFALYAKNIIKQHNDRVWDYYQSLKQKDVENIYTELGNYGFVLSPSGKTVQYKGKGVEYLCEIRPKTYLFDLDKYTDVVRFLPLEYQRRKKSVQATIDELISKYPKKFHAENGVYMGGLKTLYYIMK